MSKISKTICISVLFINLLYSSALCASKDDFIQKLKNLKWVAYSPTSFNPESADCPLEESIAEDLLVLYRYGFRGIVSYGAYKTLGQIPRIAKEIGFEGIIMGIWDISSQEEIMNAIEAGEFVDGYCLGNEGLNKRYGLESLKEAIYSMKESTGKPATTTEEIEDYYNNYLDLVNVGDWVFPNVHPFVSKIKDPGRGVKWVGKHYQLLKKRASPDKIILIKETGFPTKGAPGASESNQKVFFLNLEAIEIPFVFFEAFDQLWKTVNSVESHWGLFDHRRKPKKFISSQKNS